MTSLYTEVSGEGAPLVLLHGWGLNVRVWDSIAPQLATRYKVIAIDLPGHGRSEWNASMTSLRACAEKVAETCREIATRNVTVLGWSLGGQIALQMAASEIDISRLVLVATTPKFAASDDWPHGMRRAVLEGFAQHLSTDYRRTVSDFLSLQARGSANSDAVLSTLQGALFSHGEATPAALEAGLSILQTLDLRDVVTKIPQPAVVIAGQYDRVTPPSACRALAELLPNATYTEIRRAGHAPFLSHPDTVLAAL
jgi:pimeloyl-[acyl-carrier protein] methyl ester esterase